MRPKTERAASKKERPGFSAKTVIIPAMIIIMSMHVLIVVNTLRINRSGQSVSETVQSNFAYSQAVKELSSTANSFTDLARAYISTGAESYLVSYLHTIETAEEQNAGVKQMLMDRSPYAYAEIVSAVRFSEMRIEMECRALRLAAEGYGVDLARYPRLADAELTEEEKALGAAEKQRAAALLLISTEYLQTRGETNERISRAAQLAGEETARSIGQQTATLEKYRALQWVMTLVVISVLVLMCALLFLLLLNPLKKSANRVQKGEELPTDKGFSELRSFAASYNELLRHRKTLEDYLRKQSRTDALTGLPNRLAFQDYVSHLSWEKPRSSVTAFSLDVDGLKKANDEHGHAYGDELLRNCGACIQSAFGGEGERHCFRFGGDEFAAFWVDAPKEEIASALEKFRGLQRAFRISISVGYAFAESLSATTVEELFEQADKNMYEAKAERHRGRDAE